MASDAFNIDEAEDFDDGTRAVAHAPDSDGELTSLAQLSSSRKQRLQAESESRSKQREHASYLRVKNWDAEGIMDSKEYAGKVVKRKELRNGMESPDEDEMAEWSDAQPFGTSDDEKEVNEEVEKEDESEDNEDEDKRAEKLIRGFQKEDSARLMGAHDSEKVVHKANLVRKQKLFWDRCLEVQIYTKRMLNTVKNATANETDVELSDEDTRSKTKEAIAELYKCIDAVSSLQSKLCNIPELSAPDAPSKKRKCTSDDLWQEITTSNRAMLPQYNDILNTCMRKTDLAAGGKKNQAKKFKVVNQDILAQVDAVLVDPQRVKRKAHAPLQTRMTEATEGAEDLLDELMYDDSEFYQQVLKEFIESGGGAGQDTIVRRTYRKKKIVNRKASKGRQLRYTLHPKLENFMFPEPYPTPDMDVDELFRSLFGQLRQ